MPIFRVIYLGFLLTLASCATKFRFPLNRMISPESVGGAFNGEFELGQQGQAEGKIDVSQASPYPMKFNQRMGTSFFGALSLIESFDFYWNHTASAPSLIGGRWQFIGNSQLAGGSGHSMAITGAVGGNEHEIDGNPKVEFKVGATDFSLIHGYWFTANWQIFESLGYSTYSVEADLSGSPSGRVDDEAKQLTAAIGTALVFKPGKIKIEAAYTKLDWSSSGNDTFISYALALGFNF